MRAALLIQIIARRENVDGYIEFADAAWPIDRPNSNLARRIALQPFTSYAWWPIFVSRSHQGSLRLYPKLSPFLSRAAISARIDSFSVELPVLR